jgi:hypothetical protein
MEGSGTQDTYERGFVRLIHFIVRLSQKKIDFPITLHSKVLQAAETFHVSMENGDPDASIQALHELAMELLRYRRGVNVETHCPVEKFIMFDNVGLSGRINEPENINSTVTHLKWCLRGAVFHETLRRIASAPEGTAIDQ